jgi:hypothetical protein
MPPRRTLLTLIVTLALAAPTACKGSSDACPDVTVTQNCQLRCKSTAQEGGVKKICSKYLLLSDEGNNEILQRKTKRIETRQLAKETCFSVDTAGKLTDAAEVQALESLCKRP